MKSKTLVVRLLGLLTIAILASNVEATNNVGAPGLAAALASIPLPDQAAWDDLGAELRHVREADIFDSSRDLDSVGSQLGRLSGALFLNDRRLLIADGMNAELHLVWDRGASSSSQSQFAVVVPRAWRLHDASGVHVLLSERDAVGRERVMVGVLIGEDQ